ncbi:MAG: hypothetical protein KatS3mg113_1044 [Planctomycetaceae bacterium]|nr:MAG: hypothetical protein KatS3mg113_1044 [Planctomycetaceae bacterium]
MYLVLIETSGNQSYIFSTNRLRENVGASELTYRMGTQWVLEAVKDVRGPDLWTDDPSTLRLNLISAQSNPPLEQYPEKHVEVILAASGKAILLVDEKERARTIVNKVTVRALEEAPGLQAYGVILPFDFNTDVHAAMNQLHARYESVRSQLPGADSRFLRIPVITDCQSSGYPAAKMHGSARRGFEALSAMSISKLNAADPGLRRIRQIVPPQKQKYLPMSVQQLSAEQPEHQDGGWLAVIHADGNGLGQVFLNFDQFVNFADTTSPEQRNRRYIDQLRAFSLALDVCTAEAFRETIDRLAHYYADEEPNEDPASARPKRLLVPLVLGGDDLTVVCEGQAALAFSYHYVKLFHEKTSQHADIQRILRGGAFCCVGVAIVKPHFPF